MTIIDARLRDATAVEPERSVDLTDAEVRAVALGGWRVSDSRVDLDDPRRLLGFIEARDGGFEVMRIGADFTWTMFSSMVDALTDLLTAGRKDAAARASSDKSWISALPKSSFDEL